MSRLALSLTFVAGLAAHAAGQGYTVDVTASALNVRTGVLGTKLGVIHRGQSFVTRAQRSGWYQINWRGRQAWISGNFARRSDRATVEITASALNARTGPSTRNRVLTSVARGQRYVLLGHSGNWVKIQLDARQAWVHSSYTRSSGPSAAAPPSSSSPSPAPAPSGGRDLVGLDVAIDSGHGIRHTGRFDPGAVNRFTGITEYQLNREVAFRVERLLEARGARVSVYSYPRGSRARSLYQKGQVARGHDLFVSIHHNAFNASAQGSEVLVHNSRTNSSSRRLAQAIQSQLVRRLWNGNRSFDRGVKRSALGVLTGAHSVVRPAVLVEGFFIDTRQITRARATQWVEAEAQAIAAGIAAYWGR